MSNDEIAIYRAVKLAGFGDPTAAINFASGDAGDISQITHVIANRLSPIARLVTPGNGVALYVPADGGDAEVVGIERINQEIEILRSRSADTAGDHEADRLRAVLTAIWDKYQSGGSEHEPTTSLAGTLAYMAKDGLAHAAEAKP